MNGVVIAPRRRVALAPIDPARARAIFIREALAAGHWTGGLAPLEANRRTIEIARAAESKLRRRGVVVAEQALAEWFDQRLPADVVDPASLVRALDVDPSLAHRLTLTQAEALSPDAALALDQSRFPDQLDLGAGVQAALEYALAPGKPTDGLTATLTLEHLPRLSAERAAWLVPGMLPELVHWLLRSLPKEHRTRLERSGALSVLADEIVAVIDFASGPLPQTITDATRALRNIEIEPHVWPMRGRPDHLRLRVRVLDDSGQELAAGRDVEELSQKLAPRLRKIQVARALQGYQREGLTTWDFGELPDGVEVRWSCRWRPAPSGR
ncbi:DUF3418 domain-containing protein [Leptolyngbya sp. 15MV]|nr:DUF3418 domain-containing protein [Leptolyngbya sp. 15MV]